MKKEQVTNTFCPIGIFSKIFNDRWKLYIVFNVMDVKKRFKVLCDIFSPFMTQKTLSVKLKELEEEGIIERKVYAEVPPHVEYGLTEKGKTLIPIIKQIHAWGTAQYKEDESKLQCCFKSQDNKK
ncbi:winged helix-turn-helix transcriptional regulator [Helicobacter sp. 11S02629-2]|uniref:winged helix-turn-helix transcriptional regulator n=1 Tax=Helicobacter sp. 11S02629-2 TaxID=1476195 RepID=UPI000BA5A480|nr:winged helix-turn-helix transcriptional regulator [Helicobacter sp. 11S02629-2]PAF45790.1 hypothetical protein BKH40_02650 [Helicobacter sp. 11S02629-2]